MRAASRAATGALVGFRRADARRRKNFFTLFFFFFHHRLSVTKRKRIINCLREKPNERAPAPFCARFYGVPWRRRVCVALFSFFFFCCWTQSQDDLHRGDRRKVGEPCGQTSRYVVGPGDWAHGASSQQQRKKKRPRQERSLTRTILKTQSNLDLNLHNSPFIPRGNMVYLQMRQNFFASINPVFFSPILSESKLMLIAKPVSPFFCRSTILAGPCQTRMLPACAGAVGRHDRNGEGRHRENHQGSLQDLTGIERGRTAVGRLKVRGAR